MIANRKWSQLTEILKHRKELDEIIDTRFRRTATILFTDIVGSTAFFSARGDIEGQLMIQRHNDLLIPLLAQYQGSLIQTIGDSIFATFQEPAQAVACAVKMLETLTADNQQRPEKDRIQVRIGINAGSGYVENGRVHGVVVNIAERIKSLAGPSQILVSESVYATLQPGTDPLCTFIDKVTVKGVSHEIKIYQVLWRKEERQRRVRRNPLRDSAAVTDVVLEASRENGTIKICVYDKSEGTERTLRPYENLKVDWDQLEANRSQIVKLLNRANKRAKITPEILADLRKTGQVLFELLIPLKAREKMSTTRAKNLILFLDDKLVHIPWELLFNGEEFLCRRFAIGRIVSTRQTLTSLSSRSLTVPFKVLVLADPRGDLDASYREGMEVRNFLDEKRDAFHVDFKSYPVDLPFVKKNLRDYDIVHYAGHADYDAENPSESGWLLTDGRFRASEISAMGGLQPMPSLVFSNACQSGHTPEWRVEENCEQQMYGLANAYLLAGVHHYIGTFWEILDEPGLYFAKSFYGFLATGEKIGEAVRRAREDLIQAYGEETIVWASYMLYGDPTFSLTAAERDTVPEAARNHAAPAEWTDVTRAVKTIVPPAARVPSHLYFRYGILAILLVALLFTGYGMFVVDGMKDQQLAGTLASPSAEEVPPLIQNGIEEPLANIQAELGNVQQEIETGVPIEPILSPGAAPVRPQRAKPETANMPDTADSGLALLSKITPSISSAPLTMKMNIIGQRKEPDGSYSEVIVSEASVLRSYDNFQIHLETSRPAYAYVLIYDSQGKASQLFPDPKIDQAGFIQPGARIAIPSANLWFWLDEETGTETIYVLASEKPLKDIQTLLVRMQGADAAERVLASDEIKQRITTVQRGVGGITKGQSVAYTLGDGKKIEKVTEIVTDSGAVVRAVSFQHR